MKLIITGLLALGFCLGATGSQAASLTAIRGPIEMDYGASPRFAVTFNHSSHKNVKCRTCHHIRDKEGRRYVQCTIEECHSVSGARRRDPLSMFMAYHARGTDRSCYGCHKMEAAKHPEFKGCRPCHMGPLTRKVLAEKKAD